MWERATSTRRTVVSIGRWLGTCPWEALPLQLGLQDEHGAGLKHVCSLQLEASHPAKPSLDLPNQPENP